MTYADAVLADSPYVYYRDGSAAPWVDVVGGLNATINGATAGVTGPLTQSDTQAFQFDGVNDWGQVALDLTSTNVITVEFWLWWDAFASDDDLAFEYTASWFTTTGGFSIDPNLSTSAAVSIALRGDVGNNQKLYPRPSAAVWHHYAVIYDFSQAATDEITAYLDGTLWTPSSQPDASNNTGNHVASNLNLMCRNSASLFGAGRMAHVAIYKSALSQARIGAHYQAAFMSPRPIFNAIPFLR